jgi:choline dehydrogenase-like flavoprotein
VADDGFGWAQTAALVESGLRSALDYNAKGDIHPFERHLTNAIVPKTVLIERFDRAAVVTANATTDAGQFAGTCALGRAVDDDLRLRGVDGVWVADSSVVPKNCNADMSLLAQMIGYRCAKSMIDDASVL